MSRRGGDHGTLFERIHGTSPPGPIPPTSPVFKHCWVNDHHGRLPALLLEWRRVASGFQGRVVRASLQTGEWCVIEEWLPAELLEPASYSTAPGRADADSQTRSTDVR